MDRLPEYLRYTTYGQRIQRNLNSSGKPPSWIESSLIYDPGQPSTPSDSNDSDDGFPMIRPSKIHCKGPDDDYSVLPTSWDLDNRQDELLARNGVIHVSNDIVDNKEICLKGSSVVSPQCGTWYYEVTFGQSSKEIPPCMIGFCPDNLYQSRPSRRIGAQPSWLYFSDDGRIMSESGSSRKFGPSFGSGDTIGCGVNFRTNSIFYTKNGLNLGTAFSNLSCTTFYPFIGVKAGYVFSTNFGAEDFKFDIVNYVLEQKAAVYRKIDATSLQLLGDSSDFCAGMNIPGYGNEADEPSDSAIVLKLVSDYLEHMCYSKSVQAIKTEMNPEGIYQSDSPVSSEMLMRQRISSKIMAGEIEEAIELIRTNFPDVLLAGSIDFQIKCQQMAKAVRCDDLPKALALGRTLKAQYGDSTDQRTIDQLRQLFGTLAYSRADGGAPYEEELYGPQALAELSTKINTCILTLQGVPGVAELPNIIDKTVEAVEMLAQHDYSAAHLNVFEDVL